jgi:hypothetical protein
MVPVWESNPPNVSCLRLSLTVWTEFLNSRQLVQGVRILVGEYKANIYIGGRPRLEGFGARGRLVSFAADLMSLES